MGRVPDAQLGSAIKATLPAKLHQGWGALTRNMVRTTIIILADDRARTTTAMALMMLRIGKTTTNNNILNTINIQHVCVW